MLTISLDFHVVIHDLTVRASTLKRAILIIIMTIADLEILQPPFEITKFHKEYPIIVVSGPTKFFFQLGRPISIPIIPFPIPLAAAPRIS